MAAWLWCWRPSPACLHRRNGAATDPRGSVNPHHKHQPCKSTNSGTSLNQPTSNPALVILNSSLNHTESCHKGTQQVSFICSILSLNGCGREARQKLLRFFSFRGEGYPPFALSLTEKIRKQNSEIGILTLTTGSCVLD